MATRPLGTGYDPNSGWPPDDSTNVPWDSDVDLSGYGRFGGGGFTPNPKLTGPVTGNYGTSLTARPATPADAAAMRGPQMTSGQPNLRPGMSPVVRNGPGPYTDASLLGRVRGWLPGILGAASPGAAVPAIAAAGSAAGLWAEPRTPRVDPRISAAGTGGLDVEQPLGAPQPTQPMHPNSAAAPLPYESGFPTPTAAPSGGGIGPDARFPVGPPITAPAMPPVRPRVAPAAGPAAAQQQPNLGNYAPIYQPNIARTGNVRGGRSGDDNAPMMGAPDWSKLFQRPQQ